MKKLILILILLTQSANAGFIEENCELQSTFLDYKQYFIKATEEKYYKFSNYLGSYNFNKDNYFFIISTFDNTITTENPQYIISNGIVFYKGKDEASIRNASYFNDQIVFSGTDRVKNQSVLSGYISKNYFFINGKKVYANESGNYHQHAPRIKHYNDIYWVSYQTNKGKFVDFNGKTYGPYEYLKNVNFSKRDDNIYYDAKVKGEKNTSFYKNGEVLIKNIATSFFEGDHVRFYSKYRKIDNYIIKSKKGYKKEKSLELIESNGISYTYKDKSRVVYTPGEDGQMYNYLSDKGFSEILAVHNIDNNKFNVLEEFNDNIRHFVCYKKVNEFILTKKDKIKLDKIIKLLIEKEKKGDIEILKINKLLEKKSNSLKEGTKLKSYIDYILENLLLTSVNGFLDGLENDTK